MIRIATFALFLVFCIAINCTGEDEDPLICHLYGYMINNNTQQGIDGLIVRIVDINPYDIANARLRYDTTITQDSIPGFFEMDSVCYGTTKRQGNLVLIGIHENENPGWPTQFYTPDIFGDVDTVYIYLLPD
jgi:hypothetical protein